MVIPGNKNCDIRNIHWLEINADPKKKDESNPLYYKTNDNKSKKRRLITSGLNGVVIEWDLLSLSPKSKYVSHSAIWDSKMFGKYIYLACEDGTIKILKIKKSRIELIRSLVRVDQKCISLALVTT